MTSFIMFSVFNSFLKHHFLLLFPCTSNFFLQLDIIGPFEKKLFFIFFRPTLGRKKFANAKDNEFNSAAISLLWHPPAILCSGQIKVAGIRRR